MARHKYPARREHKLGGRPEMWTEEKLGELAENVLAYAKKHDSLHIIGWRAEVELTRAQILYCCEKSAQFSDSYELAKQIIGARRAGLALNGDISERIYLKENWNYDSDTRAREDEKDKNKVEQQIGLLAQLQATDDLVNKADPHSNIPMAEQND